MDNLQTRDGFAIKFAADGEIVEAHNGEIALALVPGARAYAFGWGSTAVAFGGSIAHAYKGAIANAFDGSTAYASGKGAIANAYGTDSIARAYGKDAIAQAYDGSTAYAYSGARAYKYQNGAWVQINV